MSTASQAMTVPESFAPPCPEWCTLRPGHGVDAIHGEVTDAAARRSRCHSGPRFGQFMHAYADEFTDAPEALVVGINLSLEDVDGTFDFTDSEQLAQFAADLAAAREWLEARR